MRKLQALIGIAALLAAPLALLAHTGACTSCMCTMLCCMPKAHHGAMAGMADCHHGAAKASNCAGWRCHCYHAPDGSLAAPWLPVTLPGLAAPTLPRPAGAAFMTAEPIFASVFPSKDTPPPRS